MKKSLQIIGNLGIATMIIVMFMMLMYLQNTPKVGKLLEFGNAMKTLYGFEQVIVSRAYTPDGLRYRVTLRVKTGSPLDKEKLMQEIGRNVWENPPEKQTPSEVFVVWRNESGSACNRKVESTTKKIESPAFRPVRKK